MKPVAKPLPLTGMQVTDRFFAPRIDLVRTQMLPYQWEALNDRLKDTEPSHCIENFRIAAGISRGEYHGMVFQDSDLYKWLEAVAYQLAVRPDPSLREAADSAIRLIGQAQTPEGYLNTYYQTHPDEKRFSNLQNNHELYCAGHLIEAAVAFAQAVGDTRLLDVARRYADLIDRVFGPEEGKLHGYPGHEIIEMALVRLFRLTGEERYLRLARYFIDQRGQAPLYFEEEARRDGNRDFVWNETFMRYQYYQAGKPVREQTEAEGHAVRAVYLYSGMADVAAETGDQTLFEACRTLFDNIVSRRMYITGAIGSTHVGEAFTYDYDLPNDTMYCETCASVGLVFFAKAMMENEADGEYGDVMERALYNTVLSGTALDGKHFFYVNPLEVNPVSSALDPGKSHVKAVRPEWLGCACCPPNLARLLASVDQYVYTAREDCCFVNLYMSSESCFSMKSGEIRIRQETGYPVSGKIRLQLEKEAGQKLRLGLRIPSWARTFALTVNGEACRAVPEKGFVLLDLQEEKNEILLDLPMKPELWRARADLRSDIGKAAVGRGPLVYCLEEADNGKDLQMLSIKRDPDFAEQEEDGELGHIVAITAAGIRRKTAPVRGGLYGFDDEMREEKEEQRLRFIPYYTWANRGSNEMSVWVRTE